MKRSLLVFCICPLVLCGCSQRQSSPSASNVAPLAAKAYGAQIVEISGGKQFAGVGGDLPQPVVVQVNNAGGNAVAGAVVNFRGDGLSFNPAQALSDSSGQASTVVTLGFAPGDFQVIAETAKAASGPSARLDVREIALGYQATLGSEVNDKYCIRCHDQESTPERVSNFDNLSPPPHAFTDGAYLNKMSDADLMAIIAQGGPALKKSPQTPAYQNTLSPAQIKAVVAFIRAVADPPYTAPSQSAHGATK